MRKNATGWRLRGRLAAGALAAGALVVGTSLAAMTPASEWRSHEEARRIESRLLVARAVAVRPGFRLTSANAAAVLEAPVHPALQNLTRLRIATTYLDFVRYFLDAREGTLPVHYEPAAWDSVR